LRRAEEEGREKGGSEKGGRVAAHFLSNPPEKKNKNENSSNRKRPLPLSSPATSSTCAPSVSGMEF